MNDDTPTYAEQIERLQDYPVMDEEGIGRLTCDQYDAMDIATDADTAIERQRDTIAALRADVQRLEESERFWISQQCDTDGRRMEALRLADAREVDLAAARQRIEHLESIRERQREIDAAAILKRDERISELEAQNFELDRGLALASQHIAELEAERAQLRERDFRTGWAFGWTAREESPHDRADRQRRDWDGWIAAEETPDV